MMLEETKAEDVDLVAYKKFVDRLVTRAWYPRADHITEGKQIPRVDDIENAIEHLYHDKVEVAAAWSTMTEKQKQAMALLVQYRTSEAYDDGVIQVLEQLDNQRIIIDEVELPEEPYHEQISHDYVGRAMGYEWEKERLDRRAQVETVE